ncbi:uncharacterized protein LOC132038042 [Lycium ferocissimum]|uniref:uncharacterized protein LOC132038042 n=1 Tax=Lycium ferocissimum TaxID=112874 RepID=UPI00281573BB|nr:uncharacterized protein LOC132038042 [Lycium ferocissimum]
MANNELPVENVFADEPEADEDFYIQRGVTQEAVRLKLFKYSLAGEARKWFIKLPRNSIATWDELVKVFLRKWYPPSKRAEIRDQIYEVKQRNGEQLFEAWERYKEYLDRSTNHGFPEHILKDKFYRGLDPMTQAIANNAASGCFMNKSYANITDILDRLTTHSQAWHSSNSDGLSLGTPLIQNIMKDSQETQQTLAQLATSLSLLTKRLDEREAKKGSYNQRNYNNNQGNYNNNYGGSNQGRYNNNNGNFGNRSSNPYIPPKGQSNDQSSSRLESMLEKVLASQKNTEKTLSGLSETNGGGVERTFAISTRSGKILQGADKKVVDLEPIIEEEEVRSDVPIIDEEVLEKVVDIPEVAADTGKHSIKGALRPLTQMYKEKPPFP